MVKFNELKKLEKTHSEWYPYLKNPLNLHLVIKFRKDLFASMQCDNNGKNTY